MFNLLSSFNPEGGGGGGVKSRENHLLVMQAGRSAVVEQSSAKVKLRLWSLSRNSPFNKQSVQNGQRGKWNVSLTCSAAFFRTGQPWLRSVNVRTNSMHVCPISRCAFSLASLWIGKQVGSCCEENLPSSSQQRVPWASATNTERAG